MSESAREKQGCLQRRVTNRTMPVKYYDVFSVGKTFNVNFSNLCYALVRKTSTACLLSNDTYQRKKSKRWVGVRKLPHAYRFFEIFRPIKKITKIVTNNKKITNQTRKKQSLEHFELTTRVQSFSKFIFIC